MKSVVALVLVALCALQFAPVTFAEQTASAHALGTTRAYDITFALSSHTVTIRSCDLVTRLGSSAVEHYTTLASSNIAINNPAGGSTAVGIHMQTNSTSLAFAGDFVLVNGQLTAVDGSGTDRANGDSGITVLALPAAIVPNGLPVC